MSTGGPAELLADVRDLTSKEFAALERAAAVMAARAAHFDTIHADVTRRLRSVLRARALAHIEQGQRLLALISNEPPPAPVRPHRRRLEHDLDSDWRAIVTRADDLQQQHPDWTQLRIAARAGVPGEKLASKARTLRRWRTLWRKLQDESRT